MPQINPTTTRHWDLSDLYDAEDIEAIARDMALAEDCAKVLSKKCQERQLPADANGLSLFIAEYETVLETLLRVRAFIDLMNVSPGVPKHKGVALFRIGERAVSVRAAINFFPCRLAQHLKSIDASKLEAAPLERFKPWLLRLRRYAHHLLSEDAECLLDALRDVDSELFSAFSTTHIPMASEHSRLNPALLRNERDNVTSTAPENRQQDDVTSTFYQARSTMLLDACLNKRLIEDRLRGLGGFYQEACHLNGIEADFGEKIVSSFTPIWRDLFGRYERARTARDRARRDAAHDGASGGGTSPVGLAASGASLVSWDSAVDLVVRGLSSLSNEFGQCASIILSKPWIHTAPLPTGYSAPFTHPTVPSVHPYVFCPFRGSVADTLTLAHELGHAVHYMSSRGSGVLHHKPNQLFAETFAVLTELSVTSVWLSSIHHAEARRQITWIFLDRFVKRVTRHLAASDFLKRCYDARKLEPLRIDRINDIWSDIIGDLVGNGSDLGKAYCGEWAGHRIIFMDPFLPWIYAASFFIGAESYSALHLHGEALRARLPQLLSKGASSRVTDLYYNSESALSPPFWSSGQQIIDRMLADIG